MSLLNPGAPPAADIPRTVGDKSLVNARPMRKTPSFEVARERLFQDSLSRLTDPVIPGSGFSVDEQREISNTLNNAVDDVEGQRSRQIISDTKRPTGLMSTGPSATSAFFDNRLTRDFGDTLNRVKRAEELEAPLKRTQRIARGAENIIRSENLKFADWSIRQKLYMAKKTYEANEQAATAAIVGTAVGVVGAVAGGVTGGPAGAAAGFAAGNAVGQMAAGA